MSSCEIEGMDSGRGGLWKTSSTKYFSLDRLLRARYLLLGKSTGSISAPLNQSPATRRTSTRDEDFGRLKIHSLGQTYDREIEFYSEMFDPNY